MAKAKTPDAPLFAGGRVIGIDPGSNTGLVCLQVPESLEMDRCHWLGSSCIRPSAGKNMTHAERDRDHSRRLAEWIALMRPDLVVLEEPLDGQASWRGAGFQKKQSRDTAFRLGQYYGAAVSAVPDGVPMMSYPVTDYQKRLGWMRRQSHATVELRARAVVAATTEAVDHKDLTDHELMAVGVVCHHLAVLLAERQLARIEKVRGKPL